MTTRVVSQETVDSIFKNLVLQPASASAAAAVGQNQREESKLKPNEPRVSHAPRRLVVLDRLVLGLIEPSAVTDSDLTRFLNFVGVQTANGSPHAELVTQAQNYMGSLTPETMTSNIEKLVRSAPDPEKARAEFTQLLLRDIELKQRQEKETRDSTKQRILEWENDTKGSEEQQKHRKECAQQIRRLQDGQSAPHPAGPSKKPAVPKPSVWDRWLNERLSKPAPS